MLHSLKSWSKKFKCRKHKCSSVGGFTDNVDIVNAFADNFPSVCHHNFDAHNRLRLEFVNKLTYYSSSVDRSSLVRLTLTLKGCVCLLLFQLNYRLHC